MSETKTCTKCGETKALEEFRKDSREPSGRTQPCRPCHREYQRESKRERYWSNPEYRERELERYRERYWSDPEYRKRKIERKRERRKDPLYRMRKKVYMALYYTERALEDLEEVDG